MKDFRAGDRIEFLGKVYTIEAIKYIKREPHTYAACSTLSEAMKASPKPKSCKIVTTCGRVLIPVAVKEVAMSE